ncbi:Bug family tripartite tricarboxylate transporter substrate binding protein [Bordetella petrii]|uniref:Bug family tripartite tricarboxylate transporter substrate binding protein n=1 Tax=Bordetella petrii TaxID=94624 RepID=UPI001E32DB64|nr:tripartite tricarboxylate transporter substrate binding protein [Bordetella petrii]MCD0505903.1 tripartite tricarboxylate transporter substrate binding protein [Bordetella petrii]
MACASRTKTIARHLAGSVRALAAMAWLSLGATAQAGEPAAPFPDRPVKLVVPFPPGGGTDTLARPLAQRLGEYWGQSVVIENRGGAGGNVGAAATARSAPDGYTLLFTPVITLAANQSLYKSAGYDAVRDFTAVTMLVSTPNILAVPSSLPVKTMREFLDYARAHPGQLNFASPGNGTPPHLATEILMRMADIKLTHVPYKGTGPAVTDLIAGRVQAMMVNAPVALPYMQSGQLRGLATTSAKRPSSASGLPTLDESGLKGYEADTWYGLFAPAGTPKAVIAKINTDVVRALNSPDIKKLYAGQGADVIGDSPESASARVRADVDKWRDVINDIGLKVD